VFVSSLGFHFVEKPPERGVMLGEFGTSGFGVPTLVLCEFEFDNDVLIRHGARQAGDVSGRESQLNQGVYVSVAIVGFGLVLWNVFTICTLHSSQ
jgi:hypothetical protein